jgi:hypothetical protein
MIVVSDLLISFLLYILYIIVNPGYLDGFPKLEQMIPLDLLLLAVTRCGLLSLFLQNQRWSHWAVTTHIPLLTTIVEIVNKVSLAYILIRSKLATTVIAYLILGFQFCFCWLETGCYVHAMLIHGIGYWENQFQILDSEIDCLEDGHDFVFPDSVQDGYQAPAPLQIQADIGESDGPVAMGTSAPILINTPKRFIQDEFSHSIAFEKIVEHPSENQGTIMMTQMYLISF